MSTVRRHRTALIRGIDELPVLPTVLAEVMTLDPRGPRYFDRLVALAEQDPPFAVRVLRCANSAASCPARPILDIRGAVTRMGSNAIVEIVTSLAVARVFVPTSLGQRRLWLHALQVAVGARVICRARRLSLRSDQAYLAGLLHDVGRFVMFQVSPNDLGAVDETGWTTGMSLVEAEREICGLDHAELGAAATRRWKLPDLLVRAIAEHHIPLLERVDSDLRELLSVVQQADALSLVLLEDPGADQDAERDHQLALLSVPPNRPGACLEATQLAPLVHEIRAESLTLAQNLGVG